MLQRPCVHQDQRRMNDRAGVHQRPGERVLDGLHGRIDPADDLERMRAALGRKGARRQAPGAHGDRDLGGAVLARKIGQRSGLGEGDLGLAARSANRARHHVAAEGPRRQIHHLPVAKVGRDRARDVLLRECGRGREDEFCAAHGGADVRRRERDANFAPAGNVHQEKAPVPGELRNRSGIASPQPHLMALLGEIGGGGVTAVPAAQYGDAHRSPLIVNLRGGRRLYPRQTCPVRRCARGRHRADRLAR